MASVQALDLVEPELVPGRRIAWDAEAFALCQGIEARAGVVGVEILHESAQQETAAVGEGGLGDLFEEVPDRRAFEVVSEVEPACSGSFRDSHGEFGVGRRALQARSFDQEGGAGLDQLVPLVVLASVQQCRLLRSAERRSGSSERLVETTAFAEPVVPAVQAFSAGRRYPEYEGPLIHLLQGRGEHVEVEVHIGQ